MSNVDWVILGVVLLIVGALIYQQVLVFKKGGSCASCSINVSQKRKNNKLVAQFYKKFPKDGQK